jgi:hypothetical protein
MHPFRDPIHHPHLCVYRTGTVVYFCSIERKVLSLTQYSHIVFILSLTYYLFSLNKPGSAAAIDLASRVETAAVILHAPLASGLRVLKPNVSRTWCCDPFKNIEKMRRVKCPTLIIHGKEVRYLNDI